MRLLEDPRKETQQIQVVRDERNWLERALDIAHDKVFVDKYNGLTTIPPIFVEDLPKELVSPNNYKITRLELDGYMLIGVLPIETKGNVTECLLDAFYPKVGFIPTAYPDVDLIH